MSATVVFVPGLPGTHLHEREPGDRLGTRIFLNLVLLSPIQTARGREIVRLLQGPDDLSQLDGVIAGVPIQRALSLLGLDIAKKAQSLYEILDDLGVEIRPFGWDWRRPVWDAFTQADLEAAVRSAAAQAGEPITLIVHSTGGLLARRLLDTKHAQGDGAFLGLIRRVIAFGVPWAGTLTPVPFLTGTEGFGPIASGVAQTVMSHSWAAFDLLPPPHDPAAGTDMSDDDGPLRFATKGSQQVGLAAEPGWFGQAGSGRRPALVAPMSLRAQGATTNLAVRSREWTAPVELVNVAGWGEPTAVRSALSGPASAKVVTVTDEDSRDGDGTVPRRSAAWIRGSAGGAAVVTYHVPVGVYQSVQRRKHSSIWRTPGGRRLLGSLLAGQSVSEHVDAAADALDSLRGSVSTVRVQLAALAADASPLAGVAARAFGANQSVEIPGTGLRDLGAGRYEVTVPRNGMLVSQAGSQQLRRFTLDISWNGGSRRRSFLVNG